MTLQNLQWPMFESAAIGCITTRGGSLGPLIKPSLGLVAVLFKLFSSSDAQLHQTLERHSLKNSVFLVPKKL